MHPPSPMLPWAPVLNRDATSWGRSAACCSCTAGRVWAVHAAQQRPHVETSSSGVVRHHREVSACLKYMHTPVPGWGGTKALPHHKGSASPSNQGAPAVPYLGLPAEGLHCRASLLWTMHLHPPNSDSVTVRSRQPYYRVQHRKGTSCGADAANWPNGTWHWGRTHNDTIPVMPAVWCGAPLAASQDPRGTR